MKIIRDGVVVLGFLCQWLNIQDARTGRASTYRRTNIGLESRLRALQFRLRALQFRLRGLELRLRALERRLRGLEFRLQGIEFRLQGPQI